jgi:SAM-dependent methyltransferase
MSQGNTQTGPQPWTPGDDWKQPGDARLFAPATQRNRDAILSLLRDMLPAQGLVLEVASGSGEHIAHFAAALPRLTFQPSDPSAEALASIAAWTGEQGLQNVLPPLRIDAMDDDWPVDRADAILCINMVHIAPWAATEGLFRHAGRILRAGGPLYLYGPFRRPGRELEPGNAAFDASLRERDAEWGLRELDRVEALAKAAGFGAAQVVEMPANNLSLVFGRDSAQNEDDRIDVKEVEHGD